MAMFKLATLDALKSTAKYFVSTKFMRNIDLFYKSLYHPGNLNHKLLSTTPASAVKRIQETVDGNTTTIEGVIYESPRAKSLIKLDNTTGCCPLCRLNLDLQHTDVLILSQFVRSDGCLYSRRITGLCGFQQAVIKSLVAQAQKAGLMPNLTPEKSHKDPKKRYGHKRYNRYFVPDNDGNKIKRFK